MNFWKDQKQLACVRLTLIRQFSGETPKSESATTIEDLETVLKCDGSEQFLLRRLGKLQCSNGVNTWRWFQLSRRSFLTVIRDLHWMGGHPPKRKIWVFFFFFFCFFFSLSLIVEEEKGSQITRQTTPAFSPERWTGGLGCFR